MEITPNQSPSVVGLQITSKDDSTILANSNFGIDASVSEEQPTFAPSRYVRAKVPTNPIKLLETFPLDYSNPYNYSKFGSAADYFAGAITKILDTFPYSFHVSDVLTDFYNVVGYSYDANADKSYFRIPSASIEAPSGYYWKQEADYGDAKYVLHRDYGRLEIFHSDSSYPISNAYIDGGYISIEADGDPFGGSGNKSIAFHIRPKAKEYFDFWNGLDGFQRYMLSAPVDGRWEFDMTVPFYDSEGRISYAKSKFYIYRTDGYNPDLSGQRLADSLNAFIGLGAELDSIGCDIYHRELIPENIKDLDDDSEGRMRQLIRSLGRSFDSVRSASLGIQNIFRAGYSDYDGTIPTFMPELAKVFGIRYFDLSQSIGDAIDDFDELDLYQSNFRLWRNLLANSAWMLSAKGGRRPIEFLMAYFGIDPCYYVFDEFYYKFEKALRLEDALFLIDPRLSEVPYYPDGQPKALSGQNIHFQSFDYFDIYERAGYDWDFLVDNKKSWPSSDRYDMNSKWVEIAIDPFKAIECEIYRLNIQPNICPPDCEDTDFEIVVGDVPASEGQNFDGLYEYFPIDEDVSDLDFNSYMSGSVFGIMNTRNRKVAGAYWQLLNIFNNYYRRRKELSCFDGVSYGASEALQYIDAVDSTFMRLVRDFIPSTAKLIGGGVNVRNVAFVRNSHRYKRGIDESSLFAKPQPIGFDYEVRMPKSEQSLPPILKDVTDAIGGSISEECPLPCVPELVEAYTRGISIEIVWDCDNQEDIVGYDVERLIAGDCLDCDFDLIQSGDIISGGNFSNVEEQKWIVLAEGLLPNVDRFTDGTQVAGTDYFYRVKAYNACGEEYSDALYVDNVSTFVSDLVQGAVGLALAKLEVYRWEITSYTATPNPGTFIQTQGYLAKMADGLYYPIAYSEMTDSGTLDRQEIGYQEREVPSKIACGGNICPQIYRYSFTVVSTDASIEIY